MRVGLHDQHHCPEILPGGDSKGLLNPRDVRRVSRFEFGRAEMIVTSWNIQPGEDDASMQPSDVLTKRRILGFLTLPRQRELSLAERLAVAEKQRTQLVEPFHWIKRVRLH